MSYTSLRVVERGVILFHEHARRLGPDPRIQQAYRAFAATASPGVFSLHGVDGDLRVTPRAGSRLVDGMPVRTLRSPVLDERGPQPKRASPNPYEAVRVQGVATLLTNAAGEEVLEACVASVLAWDGSALVAVPADRPRVASVTEAFILQRRPHRRAPILLPAGWPLVLVNAVAGVCVPGHPARSELPAAVVADLRALIESTAER